jgi:hypothetical protein
VSGGQRLEQRHRLPRERLRFLGAPGEERDVREGAPAGERVVQSSDRWLELRAHVTLARLGLQQISPELERGAVGESQRPLALGGRLGVVREARRNRGRAMQCSEAGPQANSNSACCQAVLTASNITAIPIAPHRPPPGCAHR